MCKVYNTIGCLNTLKFDLVNYKVDHFRTLNELVNFQKNYHAGEEQIISNHTLFIEEEKTTLEKDISELNTAIPQTKIDLTAKLKQQLDDFNQQIENLPNPNFKIIPTIKDYCFNLVICTKFWFAQIKSHFEIIQFNYETKKALSRKNKRFEYLTSNFQDAISESSFLDLQTFEKKKEIIENLKNTIYGAIGEQKVENTLKKLSDDYILINDFCCTFKPPIYNKSNNDHICSIQIDHLLLSPAGIFLIETKNWSTNSINNSDFRSPVQQILRTNFALYNIMNNEINKINQNFAHHYWGRKKVPIKNIVLFTNTKPIEEFQFVKILTLDELLPYIKYFNPSFLVEETEMIADFLLKFSEQKQIHSKLTN
ncbi:nuclease-related domain-containing protein [Flavobacterium branchiicola]|uniref:Nuclease-related domain-containing protein n=1 Tax=Flavobacterium branchiicola TaxID=1114875 RepID=A0ABV9PAC6_9FLAO|nr:nuclease-related domain-containing protein [Flavobacterium branchiicola]MBS7253258.1 NERD domain-containing protein [Flavobacterium branchiicola]